MDENTRIVMRQWTLAQPVVSSFIGAMVRDFTDRDDVLQETAVAVLESADRYDQSRPFIAWALGIARNQIRMYLRRDSQQRLVFDESLISQLQDSFAAVSAHEVHRLRFLRNVCSGWIREQLLFQLRYAEDLKPAAIGEQLGWLPTRFQRPCSDCETSCGPASTAPLRPPRLPKEAAREHP
ncbi:MAG UNVERIFIED_CONTAM: sigma-70 family RNA polymerase sigma factor [Planctomycetaceae bacterium]